LYEGKDRGRSQSCSRRAIAVGTWFQTVAHRVAARLPTCVVDPAPAVYRRGGTSTALPLQHVARRPASSASSSSARSSVASSSPIRERDAATQVMLPSRFRRRVGASQGPGSGRHRAGSGRARSGRSGAERGRARAPTGACRSGSEDMRASQCRRRSPTTGRRRLHRGRQADAANRTDARGPHRLARRRSHSRMSGEPRARGARAVPAAKRG